MEGFAGARRAFIRYYFVKLVRFIQQGVELVALIDKECVPSVVEKF